MAVVVTVLTRDLKDPGPFRINTLNAFENDLTTTDFEYDAGPGLTTAPIWRTTFERRYTHSAARVAAFPDYDPNIIPPSYPSMNFERYDEDEIPTGSDWSTAIAAKRSRAVRDFFRRESANQVYHAGKYHGGGFEWQLIQSAADIAGAVDEQTVTPSIVSQYLPNPSPPPGFTWQLVSVLGAARFGLGVDLFRAVVGPDGSLEAPDRCVVVANSAGGTDRLISDLSSGHNDGGRIRKVRTASVGITWTSMEDATAEAAFAAEDWAEWFRATMAATKAKLLTLI